MLDEQVFRWLLIAGFVVVMCGGVYHRVKSQATRESLDRRQEGWFVLLTLRPLGLATQIGLITYMINPQWMAWSSLPLPAWLRWAGAVLFMVSGVLFIWTMHTLGKNLTDTVVTRIEHELVTTGPYAYVRHPFYCCFLLIVLGAALVAANWFIIAVGGAAWLVIVYRITKEEENLVARFGDDYRAYRATTRRFIPRFSGR